MTISNETRKFLDNQIEYYVSEAQSFRQMAQEYSPKIDSIEDAAFGIIVGCIYSSFLQAYSNMKQTISSTDMEEFTEIITMNTRIIKDALTEKN
jgi:hypothetical protein